MKNKKSNKLWCEEYKDYYGNLNPTYGGVLTDLRTLPAGTEFYVTNGCWNGKVLSDSRILVCCPTGDFIAELTDKYHSLYLQ